MSVPAAVTAAGLRARLAGLEPIGLDAATGATTRLAWTAEDRAARTWFAAQAAGLGLRVERDPAGNIWAVPAAPAPWLAIGSHTDSVRAGGRYDGALGVAAGFAIAARAGTPVAVVSFADEEGARFNTPTFGSRALTGVLDVDAVLARTDADGVTLADAMRADGVEPAGLRGAPEWLGRLRAFVELHIDQGHAVPDGAAYGVPRGLAARARLQVDVSGAVDHAGTTAMEVRSDALGGAAMVVVAALDAAGPGMRVTPTRIVNAPNALTTIAGATSVWLDGRAASLDALDIWIATVCEAAAALSRVDAEVREVSRSPAVGFDGGLRAALAIDGVPEALCWAGHDAGLLAPRVPAAMVLVRNRTGVSHAPQEHVDLEDAALAADAVLAALSTATLL